MVTISLAKRGDDLNISEFAKEAGVSVSAVSRYFNDGYLSEEKRAKIEAALGHETNLTLYCFRHNYCSELYYSEVSMKEAQRLLGHSSYKMIMDVYAHLDAQKEETKKKLNAIDF